MNLSDSKPKSIHKKTYKIAIGIDYPNMEIGLKKSGWPIPFDYDVIDCYAKQWGEVIISKIYGDWALMKKASKFLSQFEVELVNVPHILVRGQHKKDTVDTKMAIDFGMLLYEYPEVNMVIIVSGDCDFIPVVKTIKKFKMVKVIVIGERKSMSESFGGIADGTLFYQYLAKFD